MDNDELSRAILGALCLAPRLFEACDLSAGDFPSGMQRKAFTAMSTFWEESRSPEIDPVLLTRKIGGNGAEAFIGSLLNGAVRLNPEIFRARVVEIKKQAITRRLLVTIERQARTGELNLEEVREDLAYYDKLTISESILSPLSTVATKKISWLWPGRIPLGMLSLLAGSPGQGKSTLALAVAAKLSRGESLPDSGGLVMECDTLILAAEDPIAQAVRPRAEANGGDLSRIFFIKAEELDAGEIFGRLRQALEQNTNIKLLVVDPLNSFMKSGTDYFRDPDVRRSLLQPLAKVAEESGAAVLGVVHLNKRTDESGALNRIGGSVAYGAAARSVLILGSDRNSKERRLMASAKCNYCRPPGAIAFTICGDGRVEFEANMIEISADEILQYRDPDLAAEGDYISEWLVDHLKVGPMSLKDLLLAAKKESISRPSLFRVRKKIGVVSRSTGFGQFKFATWELPR